MSCISVPESIPLSAVAFVYLRSGKCPRGCETELVVLHVKENQLAVHCSSCGVLQFEHPKGIEIPSWLGGEQYQKKEFRKVSKTLMSVRMKNKNCVLCGVPAEVRVQGVRLCNSCKERVGDSL